VDEQHLKFGDDLQQNLNNLKQLVHKFMDAILNSLTSIPVYALFIFIS